MPVSREVAISILSGLTNYPFIAYCAEDYVKHLLEKIDDVQVDDYDLLYFFKKVSEDNREEKARLSGLERSLKEVRDILGISNENFKDLFGFPKDKDPEKIHEILAEPLLVLDLHKKGFNNIEKLPNRVVEKIADFKASYKGINCAIELKTIRMEKELHENTVVGEGHVPSWWTKVFQEDCKRKIESGTCEQLENTCKRYNCKKKIAFFYIRKLGVSTLPTDFVEVFKTLQRDFPEIDHFGAKDLFSREAIFFPEIDN